jgi:hypothetical protein
MEACAGLVALVMPAERAYRSRTALFVLVVACFFAILSRLRRFPTIEEFFGPRVAGRCLLGDALWHQVQ